MAASRGPIDSSADDHRIRRAVIDEGGCPDSDEDRHDLPLRAPGYRPLPHAIRPRPFSALAALSEPLSVQASELLSPESGPFQEEPAPRALLNGGGSRKPHWWPSQAPTAHEVINDFWSFASSETKST
jgi:hypothetical protein